MNQNISPAWRKYESFAFRAFSLYLLFYVFFMSDYSPRLRLNIICVELTRLTNKLFIHKAFPGFVPTADSYWAYVASLIFFILASLTALAWQAIDKRKTFYAFYEFVYVIARYYVAFELLYYGIEKLDGIQFTLQAERLIPSVGSTDPFNLYWISTGASKSYPFFGGLLETAAAILLLFRRTTTLGCLIAIPVLLNVLLINLAYDVFIKLKVFHLLLFCIFIFIPDLNRLYKFFILKQNTSLSLSHSPLIKSKRFYWVQYALKSLLIIYMFFSIVKDEIHYYKQTHHATYQELVGIFNVREFHIVRPPNVTYNMDSLKWKKLAISQSNGVRVQQMNDSIADFDFKADMQNKIIELTSWVDTTNKAKLHYLESRPGEWLFEGTYKTDSIRFSSTKIDMYSLPLLKDRGKIKWVYD